MRSRKRETKSEGDREKDGNKNFSENMKRVTISLAYLALSQQFLHY